MTTNTNMNVVPPSGFASRFAAAQPVPATQPKKPELVIPEGYRPVTFNFRAKPLLGTDGKPLLGTDGKQKKAEQHPSFDAYLPIIDENVIAGALEFYGEESIAEYAGEDEVLAQMQEQNKIAAKVFAYIADLVKIDQQKTAAETVNASIEAGLALDAAKLPHENLTLVALACAEKATRTGGIAKEVWKEAGMSYMQIMTTKHGVTLKGAESMIRVAFTDRLLNQKSAKESVLKTIEEKLGQWYASLGIADEVKFAPVYAFFLAKLEEIRTPARQEKVLSAFD